MKTLVASCCLLLASAAWGHHSYAMFDGSKTSRVTGFVAKLDWSNPHVFVWLHVPNSKAPSGYDLYAFSTASTNVLGRNGWSATSFKAGEEVAVDYWPLKDGRTGGQFIRATHADGRVTRGIGGPTGAVAPPGIRVRNEYRRARSPVRLPWVVLGFCCLGLADAAGTPTAQPDWSGWWVLPMRVMDEWQKTPPPLRPADLAGFRAARSEDSNPDPGRFCRPQQFTGYSGGYTEAVEFLITPGRVTLTNEAGLIRRIYTDGRPLSPQPGDSNAGTSIGHWEGQTLVVETTGINPGALYPLFTTHGALPIGEGVTITERISLQGPDALEFEVVTVAPALFLAPDRRKRTYTRAPDKTAAIEFNLCVDNDRSIDPATGKQRFDLTPPSDLAPPPPPPKPQ